MSALPKPFAQVAAELGDYEERFRQMADNIQEIFWMLDAGTQHVIYISPAYERICGRTCTSLYEAPLSWMEVIHPEDRDRVLQRLAEVVSGGEFDEEFRIVRPDGEIRWVGNQGFPIRDAKGNIYRVAGVAQDITKRRQAEERLRLSEAKFATAFRSSPCAMTISRFPGGAFIDVNEAFERQTEYSRYEAIGRNSLELGLLVNPHEYAPAVAELAQTGITSREMQIRTKSGIVKTAMFSAEKIQLSGEECVLTVAEDITARKQGEQALRKSEAEYRSLFDGAPYGILRASLDGNLLKVNPALVKMLGYASEKDLLAARLETDIFQGPSVYRELVARATKRKRIANVELQWKRNDGEHICVQSSGLVSEDENTGFYLDLIAQDVTEQHALEAKLRRAEVMDAVATVTSGLVHDYSTHLGRILGYSDLLLMEQDLSDGQRRRIEQIVEAAMQARSVTRYLLAMTSHRELKLESVNLSELVADLREFIQNLVGRKIGLALDLDSDVGAAYSDSEMLAQVIINLVANARDAMPDGGNLTIKAAAVNVVGPDLPDLPAGCYVAMTIADTGRGMDESIQKRIFDPFFTTKPEGKGAGLGLSYANLIIERQSRGAIRVSSQPGQGSTFAIYLPCAKEAALQSGRTSVANYLRTGCETILVVESDDVLRKLTSEFLGRQGYEVLRARTGSEALRLAEKHSGPIGLLLTETIVLGMPGVELVQRLLLSHPAMKTIYVTDHSDRVNAPTFDAPKDSVVLHKPFLSFELIGKVRKVLTETRLN